MIKVLGNWHIPNIEMWHLLYSNHWVILMKAFQAKLQDPVEVLSLVQIGTLYNNL